tara:strand:- start:5462 stop:5668 length:207 start_codon:yes stop_codon:yes gene_type:complete
MKNTIKNDLYIEEQLISNILPPFEFIDVYAIKSKKTGIDIKYFKKDDFTKEDVEKFLIIIKNQIKGDL